MNRLKELRKEKGLTQQALADDIGVTKRTYIYWEQGQRDIKSDKAQQLADYFGVPVGYLLGYEDLLDRIEEVDAELAKGMEVSKNLSKAASHGYEELLQNTLELLKSLKELAKVKQVDSDTLLEVIEVLEEHITDLDDSVQKMVISQIKYVELLNLKKKLNQYKN